MLGGKHGGGAMANADSAAPITIKRYARRRLYDPARGRYVTLDVLRDWAATGVDFSVVDVETGDDVTRVLLA
jgi:polyhydroxyalkanoate synthesis regulator protein